MQQQRNPFMGHPSSPVEVQSKIQINSMFCQLVSGHLSVSWAFLDPVVVYMISDHDWEVSIDGSREERGDGAVLGFSATEEVALLDEVSHGCEVETDSVFPHSLSYSVM